MAIFRNVMSTEACHNKVDIFRVWMWVVEWVKFNNYMF